MNANVRADGNGDMPADITAIMSRTRYAYGSWGLLEADAPGSPVLSYRANEMFIPGSSAKLFSVSAVWDTIGPDYRFTTPVYMTGSRTGPTVEGNLVLVGSGDLSLGGRTTAEGGIAWTDFDHADANSIPGATLTSEDPLAGLAELADQVHASGITRIRGDVVIDDRLFIAHFEPTPTPVMINDNLIDLVATPTRPGQSASFSYRPAAASLVVDADVETVAAGEPSQLIIDGSAPGRGGDPGDRATPLAVTQMLRYWSGRPDFAEFRACLPILGVDGSLTNVATTSPARGKVMAKTGTAVAGDDLGQRLAIQAKALAGYFQAGDGSWRAFNAVVNDASGGTDVTAVLEANEDVGEVAAALWQHAQ